MNAPLPVLAAAAAVVAASLAYVRFLRPWQLSWGATPDEVGRWLPGDEIVPDPTFDATRAITIEARPEQIWPWLRQVGVKRAGWYSYDLLDNLGRPSAREIISDLQPVAVGDVVPLSPDGKQGVQILALDLPRSILWGTLPDTTWLWVCEPQADGTTRLITRIRSRYRWFSPTIAFSMLVEFADVWMIRKMLFNLRERAEALAATESTSDSLQPLSRARGADDPEHECLTGARRNSLDRSSSITHRTDWRISVTPQTPAPLKASLSPVFRLSVVVAMLMAGVSIVGLATGLNGLYEPYPAAAAGLFAQDLVVLLVALPLLAASMLLARRGSTIALLAWGGVLFYAAYTYYFMAIGAFTALFPAYVLIVSVATYGLLSLLFALDADGVAAAVRARSPRRSIAAFFLVSVALFVILWGGLVTSTIAAGDMLSPVQHLVVAIDVAILLPILAYAGVQLLRGAPSGYALAGILIVKAGLTGFTLAFTGAFAMWSSGQFVAFEGVLLALFSVMAIVAVALWIPFARGARLYPASDEASHTARGRRPVVEGRAS